MFTGIVKGLGTVTNVTPKEKLLAITIDHHGILDRLLVHGNSVMVNGVCLSVVAFQESQMTFDLIPETLELTNLGKVQAGHKVNLEQPLSIDGELGGHVLQGHIETMGTITEIIDDQGDFRMRVQIGSKHIAPFIVLKGYIAVDGVSLTTTAWNTGNGIFEVALIPDTLSKTTLGIRQVGDIVNLETDIANRVAYAAFETYVADFEDRLSKLEAAAGL